MAEELDIQPMPHINDQAVELERNYALSMQFFLLLKSLRDAISGVFTEAAERSTITESTIDPTTADIPEGESRLWNNTSTNTLKLWAHLTGGTLKSVTLT